MAVIHVVGPQDGADARLAEAQSLLSVRGIDATTIAVAGDPARMICVTAERDGYDTIIVGRRNRHDSELLLLGSVAARVVAGALCDVVVVA